jgi:hypothetical protein
MPLAGYFCKVGAVLLALLLLADFYLPKTPVVETTETNPPAIRIHSQRKLPERVVFDTTQVVFAAITPAPWDRNPPAPPAARADGVREAFALLRADSHRAGPADQRKRQPTRRYAARRPQFAFAARPAQFAWFGFRPW